MKNFDPLQKSSIKLFLIELMGNEFLKIRFMDV